MQLLACLWILWNQAIPMRCEAPLPNGTYQCISVNDVGTAQSWFYRDAFDQREACENAMTAERKAHQPQTGGVPVSGVQIQRDWRCLPSGVYPTQAP